MQGLIGGCLSIYFPERTFTPEKVIAMVAFALIFIPLWWRFSGRWIKHLQTRIAATPIKPQAPLRGLSQRLIETRLAEDLLKINLPVAKNDFQTDLTTQTTILEFRRKTENRLNNLVQQITPFETSTAARLYSALRLATPDGLTTVAARACVLALGGASWPRLGSDAAWVPWLRAKGVEVAPFRPANVGFDVDWSPVLVERFAGQPLKNIALTHGERTVRGEAMIARYGIEGGAIYALSAADDDRLAAELGTGDELDGCVEGIHVDVEDRAAGVIGAQAGGPRDTAQLTAAHARLLMSGSSCPAPHGLILAPTTRCSRDWSATASMARPGVRRRRAWCRRARCRQDRHRRRPGPAYRRG